ncbi:hypothetical protein HZA56_20000 [Candidatus Poribacteria bacterium]|nr:hypothetical protein [Candidatus Poribacteria bacterium]
MKTLNKTLCLLVVLISLQGYVAMPVNAGMEWSEGKRLNLDAEPLDIATSGDGQWLYILAPKEILIYSLSDEKAILRIPLEEKFDRMTYSLKDNTLILTDGTKKTLKTIQLEMVYEMSMSGLPYKGYENAPITIAVFNDFQ